MLDRSHFNNDSYGTIFDTKVVVRSEDTLVDFISDIPVIVQFLSYSISFSVYFNKVLLNVKRKREFAEWVNASFLLVKAISYPSQFAFVYTCVLPDTVDIGLIDSYRTNFVLQIKGVFEKYELFCAGGILSRE